MRTPLPSLISLCAFEAAARHLSFRRAALELNITQGAISQRIKGLETLVGAAVFYRENNSIRLTETGQEYLRSARVAITELMAATDRAAGRQREDTLTICCLGTFAHKCLIPCLERFRTLYPKISLRLRTGFPFEQMAPNDSDVSILYGLGDWPGMASWKIQNEELFPVCSPSLLRGRRALKRPSDLRFHTVIRTSSPLVLRDDWPLWLAEAGVAQAKFRDEISCDLLNPIFQLAINGLGVAMGRSAVVQLDLKQKRLVEPFDIRLPSALAYYAVVPEARANSPKIERFTTWLLKEFRKSVDK